MGEDHIRHLLVKRSAYGKAAYYWNPSRTLRGLGLVAEALGNDPVKARARAIELNALGDETRWGARADKGNGAQPGTLSKLVQAFKASGEFGDLKPRTRKDYAYYLEKTELEFGHFPTTAMTAPVIKAYYLRVRTEKGITWAFHILATLRTLMSWGVSEGWLAANPALNVRMKSPRKRTVQWSPDQAKAYIAKATELGWHSIAAMAHVFDSTAQSPVDVRTLRRGNYDGRSVSNARTKTGVTDAPIPLFPEAKAALDAYLATKPPGLPEAPLFTNDRIGGAWV